VLYLGMYAQPSLAVMYAAIALGLLVWIATYAWILRGPRPGAA
jgi:hypothetical protein